MKNRIRYFGDRISTSLQSKIGGICIVANILVFIMDLILLFGINSVSGRIEQVYRENVNLNALSESLYQVQESMEMYLSVKTTDSLENYYRNEQNYLNMVNGLSEKTTSALQDRMERSIRGMSDEYVKMTSQTIEAKRGRNVDKYRVRFENATKMYDYINMYINSLNNQQLQENSANYVTLSQRVRVFESICMWVLVVVMLGNIFITMKLVGAIIHPITRLADLADDVAEGNFDIELLEVTSKDEVGTVTRAFNSMVYSIRDYISQIRLNMEREQESKERELKMEAHLKEAELKYLQAQINPHFLFNTLNAGAQLAMMEDADRTYEYIQNVSDIFRYTVRKGDETVRVSEELELVDHYISVLNVRFSGDIHYEKEIDESLLDLEMPSMILQPIVENCVNHGIREMEGKGKIWISLFKEEDKICLSVRDNGVGMTENTIELIKKGKIKEQSQLGNSNGIGLDNVIARMHLFTKNEDSVIIESEGINKGTDIRLLFEGIQMEEEYV